MKIENTHFYLQELVPQCIFEKYGRQSFRFVNPYMLKVLEFVRKKLNKPITVNNWHVGGERQWSGYRPCEYITKAKRSAHYQAQAFDMQVKNMHSIEVQQFILDNVEIFLEAGLSVIELGTIGWTHISNLWVYAPCDWKKAYQGLICIEVDNFSVNQKGKIRGQNVH